MTSKHTPGPWRLCGLSAHKVVGARLRPVADCRTGSVHPAEDARCAANARLIAAAPALLSAAEEHALPLLQLQLHMALNASPMDRELAERSERSVNSLLTAIATARGEE